jgi:hypothetical protein
MSNASVWGLDHYGNSVRLAGTSSANGTVTYGDNKHHTEVLAEYRKELDIKRLMMNRTGVCG